MPDKFSKETRSRIMSSIRSKNTQPEITVRQLLWARGKRYRIHNRSVFGNPDISNKKKKVAVFIDGCFWHGCSKCYQQPRTNTEFWKKKVSDSRRRRKLVISRLRKEGWKTMEVWEHEIKSSSGIIADRIARNL